MLDEQFDKITSERLRAYLDSKEREGLTVDYKAKLPGNSDEDKREFLADVSSFANTIGGDIFYGVPEERDADGKKTGLPERPTGVGQIDREKERSRLANLIRDGLDPRLPSMNIEFFDGFDDGPVVMLRVGRSWSSPHMIKFGGLQRFYGRSGTDKYRLDVREIRSAFLASDAMPKKMRDFQADRLARIVSGQSPIGPATKKVFCVHLLPLSAFDVAPKPLDEIARFNSLGTLRPLPSDMHTNPPRYNLDGYLISTSWRGLDHRPISTANNYVQVFRSGAIEIVSSLHLPGFNYISPELTERVLDFFKHLLPKLKQYEVGLPSVMLVSLLGVKNELLGIPVTNMPPDVQQATHHTLKPVDQQDILFQDVLIESYDVEPIDILRGVFDEMYQAFGLPRYFEHRY